MYCGLLHVRFTLYFLGFYSVLIGAGAPAGTESISATPFVIFVVGTFDGPESQRQPSPVPSHAVSLPAPCRAVRRTQRLATPSRGVGGLRTVASLATEGQCGAAHGRWCVVVGHATTQAPGIGVRRRTVVIVVLVIVSLDQKAA